MKATFAAAAICLALGGAVLAQAPAPAPASGGETIISDSANPSWTVEGQARMRPVDAAGVPGGGALNITVRRKGRNDWDALARAPAVDGVTTGDVLTFGFYARVVEPDPGKETARLVPRIHRNSPPFDAAIEQPIEVGREWRFHCIAGPSRITLARGQVQLEIRLATERHVIELGPFFATKIPAGGAARSGLPCGRTIPAAS